MRDNAEKADPQQRKNSTHTWLWMAWWRKKRREGEGGERAMEQAGAREEEKARKIQVAANTCIINARSRGLANTAKSTCMYGI